MPRTSYRLQVVIVANWEAILRKLADENRLSPEDLLLRCTTEDGQINPGGWGLWQKSFRFVFFCDKVSGL